MTLEEKKKKLLEDLFKKNNVQQVSNKLSDAAASIQPKTNPVKTSSATTTSSVPKATNTVKTSAPKASSGLASLDKLQGVVKSVQSVGQTAVNTFQRANDLHTLQKNSIAWHGTTDAATRSRLQKANQDIRDKWGLSFDPKSGSTFDAKTGINLSTPTQQLFGSSGAQRAKNAAEYALNGMQDTISQQVRATAGQKAHQTMADLYSRSAETWSDQDTQNRDAARQALADEMQDIMRRYGMVYSARNTGPNAAYTVSDSEAIERLRAAGADEQTLAYVQENIDMRASADRLGQGAEAAAKRFIGSIPALFETARQQSANVEQSRQNPEYVQLEQMEQQLELQLQSMTAQDAEGKVPADYMAVYNQLQEVRAQKAALAVQTPVDPNAWGQTMLREAGEAQANATAGLAPVPRFLADTGISIAGNAPSMALAAVPGVGVAAGAALTGLGAAGQRAAELNAQGASPAEALGRGAVAGVIEGVTEKLPLNQMASLLQSGGTSAVRNILRQMGIEAGEESASYLMNVVADMAAADPNAEFSFAELAQSALGGALSGGFFGAAGTAVGRIRQAADSGIPASVRAQQADAGARMAQDAILQAQQETTTPQAQTAQQGSAQSGIAANPYIGMPQEMLQTRLNQMQRQYWSADAQTQQMMQEDMSRISEALDSAQANTQAIGQQMAEIDAERRQAETLLPGPIRDAAIRQAEEKMQQVAAGAQIRQKQTQTTDTPKPSTPVVPLDAAFQYGKSPETAMLEATERARNEAAMLSSIGAAEYNFDPFSRMTNEYGTIEQGEKPRAREVDVPKSTDGDDRVSLFARTAMEAGATPDAAIERFEQEVANGTFSHDIRKDKESVNKARKTITQKGFNGAMDQWADVTSGRRSATKDDIVLAEILYAEAMQAGDIDMGMRLAAEIAAEGTRAGQSIQAIRLLKRTTSEGKLYYIKKTVDNVQKDLDKKYGDKAPKIEINEQLALDLLAAKTDQDAQKAMDAIYTDVAAKIPATFGDRLNAWRYFAMLGNPRTHIRNVIGNIVYQIPSRASNKLSAGLQKIFVKDKNKRTRSLLRSGKIKEFAKKDYQTMQDVLDGNQYTSEMSEIQRRKKSFPKPLQAVMDANSKALDWEDQIFKRMTYVNSMTEFLTARRVDVDNISQDTLEQARTHAINDAKRATFQDASALADFIGKIEKKNKASEIIIGGLVPFKRTPINIAKRGFELSPAGLIKGITYDLVQVKKGNMTATDAIDHISTGLTGTSLAALGAFLASQGLLSASSPENDKERNFDVAQGSQEYALNIGPYSYTIDWAAPAALPMFVGAEFYNAITEKGGDEEQAFKQATDALSRLFEPMINMTMLSGISGTLQSVGYSQTNPIFAIAENIGENYAGQFVPTLLGQVARTIDGTRRTTYADKDSWVPDSLQTFLQRQANKIPGLSQRQPAYTDVWGREERSDNVVLRAFENFISPGYISEQVSTDAETALRDLYDETGEAAILPSKPQKYYKKDGKNVYLNAEQYAKLTEEKGTLALDAINALVESGAYQSMTNEERVSAIKDIYDYSSALAANTVYGKELEGTIKTVQESGIEPGLYYAYKELQDTLSETYESHEARDEVFQTIRSDGSLTDYQKNQLYHTLLIKGTSESQWEKYTEISDTVTAEEYIDAMIQSQAIKAYGDELEEDRATTEATEFSRYLDMKQYDSAKRAALEDTFKFYNMFPAEAQNYTFEMLSKNGSKNEQENVAAIQNSGVTAAQYLTIKTLAGAAEYEKGVSGAKLAAQAAIVSQNTQNYDQYAAIMHALGYKKIEDAYTGAGTLPEATESGAQVSRQVESASGYINPVAGGTKSSSFGPRPAPTEGASTWHKSVDITAPEGTPIQAVKGGTVTSAGWVDGYGWTVHIDHGDGIETEYHHMQANSSLQPGQTVEQGQQIGAIGSTGISTGPHLDLQVWKDGKIVDPLTIIPEYGSPSGYVYDGTVSASSGSSNSSSGSSGNSGSSSGSTSTSLKKLKTTKQTWGGLDSLF